MSLTESESKESNAIPKEWVVLRNPSEGTDDGEDTAKAFCSYIDKFYWRSRNGEPNELHAVFRRSRGNKRYRYFGVPRDVYEEAWSRANNPEEYDENFGSWFNREIAQTDKYEYENYK